MALVVDVDALQPVDLLYFVSRDFYSSLSRERDRDLEKLADDRFLRVGQHAVDIDRVSAASRYATAQNANPSM